MEVWNPALDVKVKIDIPFLDTVDTYQITSRENILSLCTETMRSIEDYKTIIENQVEQGKVLELAWRMGSSLDWIWLGDDVNGKKRRWEVLCGLATKLASCIASEEHLWMLIFVTDHSPLSTRTTIGRSFPEAFTSSRWNQADRTTRYRRIPRSHSSQHPDKTTGIPNHSQWLFVPR